MFLVFKCDRNRRKALLATTKKNNINTVREILLLELLGDSTTGHSCQPFSSVNT